ncbi:RNA polymerase sigma factor [Maribacter sp. 2304DJ31-5]|uniref:RNA polymerase sigma factor n=1 Tax=Maribacter sp. 2304DJ31-5 TaxID=3386273 RepID=UPI0039BC726F
MPLDIKNRDVEHLFRNEYGKLTAVLSHKFGTSFLEQIEDVLQDTFLKAMKIWSFGTVPDNPTAWLYRVSNNAMIDCLRRAKKMDRMAIDEIHLDDQQTQAAELFLDHTIVDSQLRMIFACCHPSLSQEHQIILSLKLMGGFSNAEIAVALLKKEATIAKSFTRAKKKFKAGINPNISPVQMGLQSRLFVVFRVIYLLFSEGYSATSGATAIKRDFCYEALRLALLLRENKYCIHPNLEALIALMCFHVSRFDARLDGNKELVDLEHQDRSKYDQELIQIGKHHLENSETADHKPSHYHLEAARSYYHCMARTFADTDWKSILKLYDVQLQWQSSPLLKLNRVVAYHKVHGADDALKELTAFENDSDFIAHSLFFALKAEILLDMNDTSNAKKALERAIQLSANGLEKKHLIKKLERYNA